MSPIRCRSAALALAPALALASDTSFDGGHTWRPFDPASGGFDSVECAADGACWASERNGRVARLAFPHHR